MARQGRPGGGAHAGRPGANEPLWQRVAWNAGLIGLVEAIVYVSVIGLTHRSLVAAIVVFVVAFVLGPALGVLRPRREDLALALFVGWIVSMGLIGLWAAFVAKVIFGPTV